MIFVILGTHPLPFDRLLKAVEDVKKQGLVQESIVAQVGYTKYRPENFQECREFYSPEEMEALTEQASLVITHAGTGSVVGSLKKGKKVIAVARLKKYGEHVDDHQVELVNEFSEQGLVLPVIETEDLHAAMEKADAFSPAEFKSANQKIINILNRFVEENF